MRLKLLLAAALGIAIPLVFSSPMYHFKNERAELSFYNKSLANDVEFSFGKFNRTSFGLNTSFTMLQDLSDRKVVIGVYIDKLYGTEFKRTGSMLRVNLCRFLEHDLFLMKTTLMKHGNVADSCEFHKGQHYYLTNFAPDPNGLPRLLPLGSYRAEVHALHENGAKFMQVNWFVKLEQLVRNS